MADVATIFGVATLVIFVGFLGTLFFERTRVPDILILIALGIVLGPVTGILLSSELLAITPLLGALTLTLILFDGGLNLRYEDVVKKSGSVGLLIAAAFLMTTVAIAGFYLWWVPGAMVYQALALGAILSAVSSPIVIPILSVMRVKMETKTLLSLESSITDALAILVFVAVLNGLGPGPSHNILLGVAATLVFSTLIAVVLGIVWLELLKMLRTGPYSYVITLAVVLGLYSIVESLGGAGPVAALVFGIVLSNGREISRRLPIKTEFVLNERIRRFHGEVTFFLKTFIFVAIGVLFSVSKLDLQLIVVSVAMLAIILLARYAAVRLLVAARPEEGEDRDVLFIMMPRGLTSVVLAAIRVAPAAADVSFLVDAAFTVIILTNIVLTIGVFFTEKKRMKARQISPEELELSYFGPGGL